MDFSLSDEQKLIVETARRIGEDYGVDYWHDLDRRKAFPQECWQAICDAGLAGAALPQEHGGSGLGMYIVHGLVTAHGGAVEIADAPGGGARITVTWPAEDLRED